MIDPQHKLPDYVAPRMSRPLDEARERLATTGWIRASQSAPARVRKGDPITVEIKIENDPLGMVDKFRLQYRVAGSSDTHSKTVPAGPSARIGLSLEPAVLANATGVEFWCALLDPNDGELGALGSSQKPMVVELEGPLTAAPLASTHTLPALKEGPPEIIESDAGVEELVAVDRSRVVVAGATAATVWALWPDNPACPAGTVCRSLP